MPAVIKHGPTTTITHPLVYSIIDGMRTRAFIHRDRSRLFAGDVGRCPRKAVLHHHIPADTEVETSASGKLYMSIGSAVHAQVSDSLHNKKMLLFKEFRIPNLDLSLGGYVDDVIFMAGKVRNLEIKTCGKLPDEIKFDHRQQALMYEAVTGIKGILLYVSRSVATWDGKIQMKAIELNSTPEELEQSLASAAIAHYFSAAGLMPRIPSYFTSESDCTYCPFARICWGEDAAPLPMATPVEREALMTKVQTKVAELKERTPQRRNGVLKHIAENGGEIAREILSAGDWSTMV
jgi:hypothetical protein